MTLIILYSILIYLCVFTFPFLKKNLNVHIGLCEDKDIKINFL